MAVLGRLCALLRCGCLVGGCGAHRHPDSSGHRWSPDFCDPCKMWQRFRVVHWFESGGRDCTGVTATALAMITHEGRTEQAALTKMKNKVGQVFITPLRALLRMGAAFWAVTATAIQPLPLTPTSPHIRELKPLMVSRSSGSFCASGDFLGSHLEVRIFRSS